MEGQNRAQTARAGTASRPGEGERERGRERERESIAAAGPSMVSNVEGEREEVNELCSLILNVTLKRELCSSR